MNSAEANRDLFWQAYCYVADELSENERSQFEVRLDEDQHAREAVAKVVELSATVRSLPQSTLQAPPRGAALWQRARWMSLGVAASVLVMLSWQWSHSTGDPEIAQAESTPDPKVALAWSPAEQDETPEEDTAALTSSDMELAGDFSTPSWMTAVLTAAMQEEAEVHNTEIN